MNQDFTPTIYFVAGMVVMLTVALFASTMALGGVLLAGWKRFSRFIDVAAKRDRGVVTITGSIREDVAPQPQRPTLVASTNGREKTTDQPS